MIIKFVTSDSYAAGKLADVELHFTDGPFEGLKLIGFALWERRGGSGLNVTFPARQYSVNGERRSFALLRPITDTSAQNSIRETIVSAWASYKAERDAENLDAIAAQITA